MKEFIDCLFEGNLKEAKEILTERIEELISDGVLKEICHDEC